MKKVLFIKPFSGRVDDVAPPLGLMYLASYTRKMLPESFEFKLLDLRINEYDNGGIEKYINDYNPDIVGISACSEEADEMHRLSSLIKEINSEIIIFAGGPHPSIHYEKILTDKKIDAVFIGESEQSFHEVLSRLMNGNRYEDVKGIAIRNEGGIQVNPPFDYIQDLDSIPFPAWDLIDIIKYTKSKFVTMNTVSSGKMYMGMITSRGCPYGCIFCHNIFGKKFRKRSAENVFDEIQHLVLNYGIGEIQIFDDIFNLDEERAHRICDLIIAAQLDLFICFPNGLRGDVISQELLDKLKLAGTYMVTFALECYSDRLQKVIKKHIDKEKLLNNIKYADSIGLLVKCYCMIGFPGETTEEIQSTIDFACNSPLSFASFFIVTPQFGTELYAELTTNNDKFSSRNKDYHYYASDMDYLNDLGVDLRKVQLKAYRRFYINLRRMLKIFIRVPSRWILIEDAKKYLRYFS